MSGKLFLSSLAVFVLLSSCLVVLVEADSSMWVQTYGGTETETAESLVETLDGGYALGGRTESFGAGNEDVWLVKTDEFGNMEWNRTYGGTGYDSAESLVRTVDGGYAIAGETGSFGAGSDDAWLIKTDASGNVEWNQTYGGTWPDGFNSLIVTSDGGYALAGYTESFATVDPDITPLPSRPSDFWLVKTDVSGNIVWNQTYGGGTDSEIAFSVVEASDGGYALVGGGLFVKTDEVGNMEWNQTLEGGGRSLLSTSDGGYVIAGTKEPDFWLVKTDVSGTVEWNQTYGGMDSDNAYSVVATFDGGYAIAGYTQSFAVGTVNCWFVKTDEFGNMEWNQTYGINEFNRAFSLITTSDGGYAIAGRIYHSDAGDSDFLLLKTNEYGVVPEYSSWLIPTLLLATTVIIVINKKKHMVGSRGFEPRTSRAPGANLSPC